MRYEFKIAEIATNPDLRRTLWQRAGRSMTHLQCTPQQDEKAFHVANLIVAREENHFPDRRRVADHERR
jgi:hypothetical protein